MLLILLINTINVFISLFISNEELICIHCRLKIVAEFIHNGINSRSREIQ